VRDQAERSQNKILHQRQHNLDDVEDFKEVEAVLDQKIKNIITAMQLT
jgi:ABC-type polysaccharide/polyol phosphate transport system ATPase subunit